MRIKTPAAKVGYLLVVIVGITLTAVPLAAISYELRIRVGDRGSLGRCRRRSAHFEAPANPMPRVRGGR
ncbi:hypothetical protein JM654_05110 [Microbacterium oxydans]|nr:hypothetical protein [Microbacterium oxydans]